MKILENIINEDDFIETYRKTKSYNIVEPIYSVMSRHMFDSSSILQVFNSNEIINNQNKEEKLNEKLEVEISELGAKLLVKLIEPNEFKKISKNVNN